MIFSNKKRQITSSTVRRSVSSRFFRNKQRIFAVLVDEFCLSRTFRFCRCRDDGEKNRHLDAEIEVARATLAGMLLLPSLFLSFCSVCGVDEVHPSHLIERRDGGDVYRSFHCGRRTPKPALLRFVGLLFLRDLLNFRVMR